MPSQSVLWLGEFPELWSLPRVQPSSSMLTDRSHTTPPLLLPSPLSQSGPVHQKPSPTRSPMARLLPRLPLPSRPSVRREQALILQPSMRPDPAPRLSRRSPTTTSAVPLEPQPPGHPLTSMRVTQRLQTPVAAGTTATLFRAILLPWKIPGRDRFYSPPWTTHLPASPMPTTSQGPEAVVFWETPTRQVPLTISTAATSAPLPSPWKLSSDRMTTSEQSPSGAPVETAPVLR